jgi:hypothetical protein
MSKMREDERDRRIENRATILDEYQPSFTQVAWPERASAVPTEPPRLTLSDRVMMILAGAGYRVIRR